MGGRLARSAPVATVLPVSTSHVPLQGEPTLPGGPGAPVHPVLVPGAGGSGPGPATQSLSGEDRAVAATAAAVARRLGTAAPFTDVDRGPAGATAAQRLGALAFTDERAVHIPAAVGPLTGGLGRELLAHELTHVAQRRLLGGVVPPEGTPAAEALERQARRVAGAVAAEPAPALPAPPAAGLVPRADRPAGGVAAPTDLPLSAVRPDGTGPWAAELASLSQRVAAVEARPVVDSTRLAQSAAPAPATTLVFPGGFATGVGTLGTVQPATSPTGAPAPADASAPAGPGPADGTGPGGGPSGSVWDTLPDERQSEVLLRHLWPLLSSRLRAELHRQRERAGRLTDLHGGW